jgi:hypothetical protein
MEQTGEHWVYAHPSHLTPTCSRRDARLPRPSTQPPCLEQLSYQIDSWSSGDDEGSAIAPVASQHHAKAVRSSTKDSLPSAPTMPTDILRNGPGCL